LKGLKLRFAKQNKIKSI